MRLAAIFFCSHFLIAVSFLTSASAEDRPNILWLTSEDHGPQMGCYGDTCATTPAIDALASKGLRYAKCWSNAPVCAPARSTLISGLYPPSTGCEHMRSLLPYPARLKMGPQFLREAGYYCTNTSKEDYTLTKPGVVWDQSSQAAHWRNRAAKQPFFAVFNSTRSHESNIRSRPHQAIADPARVRVPAYHPDTAAVRQDWAQYYNGVTAADADAGKRLKELADADLIDDTIVFYYSDHGSGMPRSKRWPYNSGLHVPLIVFIPEKFKHLRPPEYTPGGISDRLVSFIDFAPTLLSLAGIQPPPSMQGHAFLGAFTQPPQPFLYGFRGRMDERYDCVRTVTDGRFVYVRNFRPDKIYAQHLAYMWQTPTTRVWEQMHNDGKLNSVQSAFWKTKPPEELYDLSSDCDEVVNLVALAEHGPTLEVMRAALRAHASRIRDVGLLPEGEMHRRSGTASPYDISHAATFPFSRIYEIADLASSLAPDATKSLKAASVDDDAAVRYWAVLGMLMRGTSGVEAGHPQLLLALEDVSADVRIAAAEALGLYGSQDDLARSIALLTREADWHSTDSFSSLAALNAIDALGSRARAATPAIRALRNRKDKPQNQQFQTYIARLIDHLLEKK